MILPTDERSPPGKSVLRHTPYTSPLLAVYVDAGAAPLAQGPAVLEELVVAEPELAVVEAPLELVVMLV